MFVREKINFDWPKPSWSSVGPFTKCLPVAVLEIIPFTTAFVEEQIDRRSCVRAHRSAVKQLPSKFHAGL